MGKLHYFNAGANTGGVERVAIYPTLSAIPNINVSIYSYNNLCACTGKTVNFISEYTIVKRNFMINFRYHSKFLI